MPRNTQSSQSQRSQSQRTRNNRQLSLEESFQETNDNINEQVSDLIRYIINRAGQQNLFKKADFKKHVLPKSGSNFQTIIDNAKNILQNVYQNIKVVMFVYSFFFQVYGYNLITVDGQQNAAKSYIISNNLPYIEGSIEQNTGPENNYPEDVHNILLLLILSHIFMSNNIVSEGLFFFNFITFIFSMYLIIFSIIVLIFEAF